MNELLTRYPIPFRKVHVLAEADEFGQLAGKSKDSIYVSPKFLDDEFMDEHMRTWSTVSVTKKPEDLIAHEFGHVLDGWLLSQDSESYGELMDYVKEPVTYEVGFGDTAKQVTAPRWQAGNLEAPSVYANESQFEYVAEAFTDWFLQGEGAKESSRTVGTIIDRLAAAAFATGGTRA